MERYSRRQHNVGWNTSAQRGRRKDGAKDYNERSPGSPPLSPKDPGGITDALQAQAATMIQALIRQRNAELALRKRVEMSASRTNIARELLATEERYVSGLTSLVQDIQAPLRNALSYSPIIDQASLNSLFPQNAINIIFQINSQFLQDLSKRLEHWDARKCVGDIVLTFCDLLRVYTVYVDCYPEIEQVLGRLRKNKDFIAFLQNAWQTTDVQRVASLLITPIQRIPRYSLLLRELKDNTWSDHADYDQICKAIDKMAETAQYVNDHAKAAENTRKIVKIDAALIGMKNSIVDPRRVFVLEGALDQFSKGEWKERYFFLFNDLLIRARQSRKSNTEDRYTFLEKVPLRNAKIDTELPMNIQREIGSNQDWRLVFCVSHPHPIRYALRCKSEEDVAQWSTTIAGLIKTIEDEEKFLDEERSKIAREKAKQASLIIASQYAGHAEGNVGGSGTLRSRLAAAKRERQRSTSTPETPNLDISNGGGSGSRAFAGSGSRAFAGSGSRAFAGSKTYAEMTYEEKAQMLKDAEEEMKRSKEITQRKEAETLARAKEVQESIAARYRQGSETSTTGKSGTLRERLAAAKARRVTGDYSESSVSGMKSYAQMTPEERERLAAEIESEMNRQKEDQSRETAQKRWNELQRRSRSMRSSGMSQTYSYSSSRKKRRAMILSYDANSEATDDFSEPDESDAKGTQHLSVPAHVSLSAAYLRRVNAQRTLSTSEMSTNELEDDAWSEDEDEDEREDSFDDLTSPGRAKAREHVRELSNQILDLVQTIPEDSAAHTDA